jgi:hypothetical protein
MRHHRVHPDVVKSARTTVIRILRIYAAQLPDNIGGRQDWPRRIAQMVADDDLLLVQPETKRIVP